MTSRGSTARRGCPTSVVFPWPASSVCAHSDHDERHVSPKATSAFHLNCRRDRSFGGSDSSMEPVVKPRCPSSTSTVTKGRPSMKAVAERPDLLMDHGNGGLGCSADFRSRMLMASLCTSMTISKVRPGPNERSSIASRTTPTPTVRRRTNSALPSRYLSSAASRAMRSLPAAVRVEDSSGGDTPSTVTSSELISRSSRKNTPRRESAEIPPLEVERATVSPQSSVET